MRRPPVLWTDAEDARLIALIGDHLSDQEIADRMGITARRVKGRIRRLRQTSDAMAQAISRSAKRQRAVAYIDMPQASPAVVRAIEALHLERRSVGRIAVVVKRPIDWVMGVIAMLDVLRGSR